MMPSPPHLLLYTDAGLKDGLATWGCVAVKPGTDQQVFEKGGRMRAGTDDSTDAELKAIANALHACLAAKVIIRGQRVKVISDNSRAVAIVGGKANVRNTRQGLMHREAWNVIRDIAARWNLTLTAGGVKGHQPHDSADRKAKHNRRCDALCRIARGEQIGVPLEAFNGVSKAARARARKRGFVKAFSGTVDATSTPDRPDSAEQPAPNRALGATA